MTMRRHVNRIACALTITCAAATAFAEDVPEKIFVDASVAFQGAQAGMSWQTAYGTLQAAIDYAATTSGYEDAHILVAEGTYYPTTDGLDGNFNNTIDTREVAIRLKGAVRLHGGYIGWNGGSPGSTDPYAPDGSYAQTILSGDIGTALDFTDNAYHVLVAEDDAFVSSPSTDGVTGRILIDGFRITGGYADATLGFGPSDDGGGLYIDSLPLDPSGRPYEITIENCTFRSNFATERGGAICTPNPSGLLKIRFSTFRQNNAREGGALWLNQGRGANEDVKIGNTRFRENGNTSWCSANGCTTTERGGAIYLWDEGEIDGSNVVFFDNEADEGAAFYWEPPEFTANGDYEQTWHHCTFAFNFTTDGSEGAYQVRFTDVTNVTMLNEFYNTVFWDNDDFPNDPDIKLGSNIFANLYSCYYDNTFAGYAAGYTVDVNSLDSGVYGDPFFDSARRDLRLGSGSACIDSADGSSTALGIDIIDVDQDGVVNEDLPLDFDFSNRVINLVPDMGAYER